VCGPLPILIGKPGGAACCRVAYTHLIARRKPVNDVAATKIFAINSECWDAKPLFSPPGAGGKLWHSDLTTYSLGNGLLLLQRNIGNLALISYRATQQSADVVPNEGLSQY